MSSTGTIDFYPRSPCGERRYRSGVSVVGRSDFYPRSPCGERLWQCVPVLIRAAISIHALLAESDWDLMGDLSCDDYFYPRSPCGERHRPVTMHTWRKAFLSTLSLRRATISIALLTPPTKFLSTLSLRRATGGLKVIVFSITHFYPRSPCGERRFVGVAQGAATGFLSTLSLRRATAAGRFLLS